jgi:mevalonate pyrophosphate decarboxylase
MISIKRGMIARRGNMALIWSEEDIFGFKWKWREKSLGRAPPYIALVKILGYMDESYISPSLEKTLKLAF